MVRPANLGAVGDVLDAMPERDFQLVHVVGSLRVRGWIVWTVPRMQMTTAGLPDLLAYHPARPGLLLAWELKRQRGRPSSDQRRAMAHLRTVKGVDARFIRPRDWPAVLAALDSRDPSAALAALPSITGGH